MRFSFRRLSYATLVIGLIVYGVILSMRTDKVTIPPLSDPRHSAKQAVSSPEPGSKVQTPTPKPADVEIKTIYVVNSGISTKWHLDRVLNAWQKAKWTDIRLMNVCPVAMPCVVISEKKNIQPNLAGETLFGYDSVIRLNLNPAVSGAEAINTVCHEFGHVLGLGHLKGTNNSCMPATGVYRVLPTKLDIQMVDSLGPWELKKMYENSGKDVDVSALPK